MIRASIAAAAVLGLGLSIAHAQPAAPNAAADAALTEGRRLYDLQEWDRAIAKFKEAYTLRDDAPALFNIAQSYRLKGDCASALSFYKTFKRKFPKEKVIAKVEKFIVEMEECASKPVAPPPPSTTTTTVTPPVDAPPTSTVTPPDQTTTTLPPTVLVTPAERRTRPLRIASYASFGVAAVGLGVGTFFALRARSAESEIESPDMGTEWSDDLEDKGKNARTFARVGLIVGGAAAIGGVAMFVLSGGESREAAPVAIVPDTTGASFVWSGHF